jgi:hypothetical protein
MTKTHGKKIGLMAKLIFVVRQPPTDNIIGLCREPEVSSRQRLCREPKVS